MKLRFLLLAFFCFLLFGLRPALQPQIVHSLAWAKKSAVYVNTSIVCRDGATMHVTWYNGSGEDNDDGDGTTTYVGARLLTTTNLPDPQSTDYNGEPGVDYGPRLSSIDPITMTYHGGVPFPADLDRDGTKEYNFYVYGSADLLWPRHLAVGDEVVFTQYDSPIYTLPVADCYLNQLSLEQGETAVINDAYLDSDYGMLAPAELMYRVDSLPAEGTLELSGAPLTVGDFFTQDDLDSSRLAYVHNGAANTTDSFNFSVMGTTRVSVSSGGAQGDDVSLAPSISANGERIAFQSFAENFAGNDAANTYDIFVHDTATGDTQLISMDYNGNAANNDSFEPSISADGNAVAFSSDASDLVGQAANGCAQEADTNGVRDIFVYQFPPDILFRASTSSVLFNTCDEGDAASYAPSLAGDWVGAEVAFYSSATNLKSSDANSSATDIFMNERTFSGTTWRYTDGNNNNDDSLEPSIARDGELIAFRSLDNLDGATTTYYDIFVQDLFGAPERVSLGMGGVAANGNSYAPSLSADGRFVAFYSYADNLTPKDNNGVADVFVYDRVSDRMERISVGNRGGEGNADSFDPDISANGRYVVFTSAATNLVSGDTNGYWDVFIHDRVTDRTTRVSLAGNGAQGSHTNAGFYYAGTGVASDDGDYVAFAATFDNLVANDSNDAGDIFLRYTGFSSTFVLRIEPERVYLPVVVRP